MIRVTVRVMREKMVVDMQCWRVFAGETVTAQLPPLSGSWSRNPTAVCIFATRLFAINLGVYSKTCV